MTARPFSTKLSPHGGRYRVPPPGARISIQALLALSAFIVLITSFASSAAHSTTLLTQSQEPIQHTGVVLPPPLPPVPSPAERLAEVLAQLPGFVPPLNTSDTDTFKAACPTHLSDWRVAHNPRLGGYDLVTFGPGEFISDVCLRGGENIFWEERMSNFILGLLRGGSAPSSSAAPPPAAPPPPPTTTTTTNPGNASSLLATMPWFLDIGSNLGVHTVAVARAGFPVVAIDANPTAVARLRCSLALNALSSQVTLLHLALGDSPLGAAPSAPAFMCLKVQDPKNVGQNHLVPCSGNGGDASQQQQQQNSPIPLLSLDSLLLQRQDQQQQQQQLPQPQQPQQLQQPQQQHPLRQAQFPLPLLLIPTPPTVVKMDVEGFEGWVLQGGKEWFGRVLPPFILMELNPHLVERAGGDWKGILDFWLGLGYHVFSVGVPEGGGGGGGREITREDFQSVDAGAALMEANSPVARCNFDFVIKRSPGGLEWPGGWPEKLCYSD